MLPCKCNRTAVVRAAEGADHITIMTQPPRLAPQMIDLPSPVPGAATPVAPVPPSPPPQAAQPAAVDAQGAPAANGQRRLNLFDNAEQLRGLDQ